MDLLGVRAFLAIVQTGTLNKAAEVLNLSQGAISYRLKILEQSIGGRLVERGKGVHRIQLTPLGETFISLAERWNLLQQDIRILQTRGPQSTLAIGVADSLNLYVLPPLYRALGQHSPAISLTIRTQHTNESFKSIEHKEIDIAFVVREIPSPGTTIEPFFAEEMVLLRLADKERQPLEIVDIQSLEPQFELYMNWSTGYQSWHDRWWDPVCPSRIRLDTAGLISILMQDILQWAIVPMSVGNSLRQAGKFVIQRLSEPAPERICYKVKHRYPSQGTAESLRILEQYLRLCDFKTQSVSFPARSPS
ncbi:LysR family transcriptional regulator [Sporomusa sp.]|uniref:LysR substrate-binding domain-containing protein n=1 Tax=Sporomusa sp. TaxID=2078658 RepID=UPI002C6DA3DD|nr:LysR family transcriptional regulator [Sporomusa sp.]HWR06992.1 LysR family transcriptional regulator [Sporomusa sp.]